MLVLELVASHLSPIGFLDCLLVCHDWYGLADEQHVWTLFADSGKLPSAVCTRRDFVDHARRVESLRLLWIYHYTLLSLNFELDNEWACVFDYLEEPLRERSPPSALYEYLASLERHAFPTAVQLPPCFVAALEALFGSQAAVSLELVGAFNLGDLVGGVGRFRAYTASSGGETHVYALQIARVGYDDDQSVAVIRLSGEQLSSPTPSQPSQPAQCLSASYMLAHMYDFNTPADLPSIGGNGVSGRGEIGTYASFEELLRAANGEIAMLYESALGGGEYPMEFTPLQHYHHWTDDAWMTPSDGDRDWNYVATKANELRYAATLVNDTIMRYANELAEWLEEAFAEACAERAELDMYADRVTPWLNRVDMDGCNKAGRAKKGRCGTVAARDGGRGMRPRKKKQVRHAPRSKVYADRWA